ncbi:MAG: DNA repair protein RecN [Bacteroidales bacterium]|nr:DNA repair protein RecN [Bacteroidales bacterium]
MIDSLEIDFPEGLIIITGETGAGKSILLGALSLVLGSKADSSMISDGADSCIVEAEFDLKDDIPIREILKENEMESDDNRLIVRRVVNASGRSRSFVNDFPVPVSFLSSISSKLLDIHSQHQTSLLSDGGFRLSILDFFAGDEELLAECKASYIKLKSLKKQLADVSDKLSAIASVKEYNEALLKQLEDAKLSDGEIEELETEQKRLANAEEIKGNLYQAEELLSPSDESEESGRLSVAAALKESARLLGKVGKIVPSASGLSGRLDSARLEIDDIVESVADMSSHIEVSPDRLDIVEERLSLLYELMKKHSCSTIAQLITARDSLSSSLFDSESLEKERDSLEKSIDSESSVLKEIASGLHEKRCGAAGQLALSIRDSIRSLELERSVFEVKVISGKEINSSGYDSVIFMFSSSGYDPVDVEKCASGGELSRIMLCLKSVLARYTNMPTMIFDEIDTGVSGSVADKMGSMICDMGKYMQVFAITHLPQVAAKGRAHYLVTKSFDKVDGKPVSSIKKLTGDERIMEVARMLSGSEITPEAIANAKTLLLSA